MAISSIFGSEILAAAFDDQAAAQAAQGRVYAPLAHALDAAYGIALPVATLQAIAYVNGKLLQADKCPTLAKGIGAKAAAVTVVQALHAYMLDVVAGMAPLKVLDAGAKAIVAPLPAWADPVQMAAKKATAKAAKEAKANQAASEELAADGAAPEEDKAAALALASGITAQLTVAMPAPIDHHAQLTAAWAVIAALLPNGIITTGERDSFIAALEKAVTATPKTAKKVRAVKEPAADLAPVIADEVKDVAPSLADTAPWDNAPGDEALVASIALAGGVENLMHAINAPAKALETA